jgi:hypothetical protein
MTMKIMDVIDAIGRGRLIVVNDRGRLLEIVLSLMTKGTSCWKQCCTMLLLS